MITLTEPFKVIETTADEFLIDMAALGTHQEMTLVGSFENPNDQTKRTAHRDIDLPFHRDGIRSQAIADLQGGMYVERPNVDIVGMYCIQDNTRGGERIPCYTVLAEAAPDADPYDDAQFKVIEEIDLRPGQALLWDNTLWHRRHGPVGNRLLIRFWVTRLEV